MTRISFLAAAQSSGRGHRSAPIACRTGRHLPVSGGRTRRGLINHSWRLCHVTYGSTWVTSSDEVRVSLFANFTCIKKNKKKKKKTPVRTISNSFTVKWSRSDPKGGIWGLCGLKLQIPSKEAEWGPGICGVWMSHGNNGNSEWSCVCSQAG